MHLTVDAQLVFEIKELTLSNLINCDTNVIDEDLENGPYGYFKCSIINNTDSLIILELAESKIKMTFTYNDINYELDITPFILFGDIVKRSILQKDTFNFTFGSCLLLGTNIFNNQQCNYTNIVLAILPTLKIIYQDKNTKITAGKLKMKSILLK